MRSRNGVMPYPTGVHRMEVGGTVVQLIDIQRLFRAKEGQWTSHTLTESDSERHLLGLGRAVGVQYFQYSITNHANSEEPRPSEVVGEVLVGTPAWTRGFPGSDPLSTQSGDEIVIVSRLCGNKIGLSLRAQVQIRGQKMHHQLGCPLSVCQ